MRILLVLLAFVCSFGLIQGQQDDHQWWNNIHNWDGVRSWSSYIPMLPGKMGPNALPVPDNQIGCIDTNLNLLLAPEIHVAPNDFTSNLFTRINVPIKQAVALQVWWVPIEYFKTDTIIRDMRAARTRQAEGFAMGDVYIGMHVPLVHDKKGWPDLMLGINLKTASGNRLQDARFTDSPGYWFELSAGKNFTLPNILPNAVWRWYASSGFYVYQTNRTDYFQNDALLLGGGLDVSGKRLKLRLQLNSYTGYFNDFDAPVVARVEAQYSLQKSLVFLRLQGGNESYPFTSVRMGMNIRLK
jgi:hypothetical protein